MKAEKFHPKGSQLAGRIASYSKILADRLYIEDEFRIMKGLPSLRKYAQGALLEDESDMKYIQLYKTKT